MGHLYIGGWPVSVLAVSDLLVDELNVPGEEGLLPGGQLLVQLEAARALQPLQVQPAPPPHAHTVQDEGTADVNLGIWKLFWEKNIGG